MGPESITDLVVVKVTLYELLQQTECDGEPVGTHVADRLVLRPAIDAKVGGFLSEGLLRPVESPLEEIVCDLVHNEHMLASCSYNGFVCL